MPEVIGFRPDDDVRLLLAKAQEATGSSATDLIQDCVRKELKRVVTEVRTKRDKAARELDGTQIPPPKHTPGESERRSNSPLRPKAGEGSER